jgi:DNA-binding GntR family transcriptional regulator
MLNQTQMAYERLREAIINGQFKPGERLVEQRVCQDYNMGRSPLREALRLLQMEGYVDVVPNKGVTISKISLEDLVSIYNIVGVLEGYAAEAAGQFLSGADIKELKVIQNSLIKAGKSRDYIEWIKQNSLFHDYIVKAANNSHLYKIIRNLRDKIRRYRYMSIIAPNGSPEKYLKVHESIIGALSKGDTQRAGTLMRRHVMESKDTVVEFLKSFPQL